MTEHLHGYDSLVLPSAYAPNAAAFMSARLTSAERSAAARYVYLIEELGRCRYFTEEERSMHVTMDKGVTTSWEQTLPDAGSTRDMLGLLRQLFGDNERASYASMLALLRAHADENTGEGQRLLDVVRRFELLKQGVLDSWDVQPGGSEHDPHPPLTVFLDWMYGEYLHSDAEKAQRIKELDGGFGLYEWQFHWISERLAALFARLAEVVRALLELPELQPPE